MNAPKILPDWLDDVRINTMPTVEDLINPVDRGILWQATRDQLLVDIPQFGRVLASKSDLIISDSAAKKWDNIGPFLRSLPLVAITLLRGGFSLNAAAVAGPNGAILLCGQTVTGKSALALALMKRGLRLMGDDAASIFVNRDGIANVAPIWPQMRLWPDTIESIFVKKRPSWLTPASESLHDIPYWNISESAFEDRLMPIKAIYHLRIDLRADKAQFSSGPTGISKLSKNSLPPYNAPINSVFTTANQLLQTYAATSSAPFKYIDMAHRNLSDIENAADVILQEHKCPTI
ncbi:hypothetical protein [Thalassospira lucentensis]|uniref:hypothetical protein n=1 Tax=Thalassospira lucentensis TaxID=168935 RepID=UPI00142D3F65|nr:hypothetical protein [Thalassospira lucentensis]NIZ01954.1 hypothetical protein [Thalassospira lucentensis]